MGFHVYASFKVRSAKHLGDMRIEADLNLDGGRVVVGALRFLFEEAYASPTGARIPGATLRKRLPKALKRIREGRHELIASAADKRELEECFRAFVRHCDQAEVVNGYPPWLTTN